MMLKYELSKNRNKLPKMLSYKKMEVKLPANFYLPGYGFHSENHLFWQIYCTNEFLKSLSSKKA